MNISELAYGAMTDLAPAIANHHTHEQSNWLPKLSSDVNESS